MDRNVVLLTIILFAIITALFLGIFQGKQIFEERATIIIYNQGKMTKINSESIYFNPLRKMCEELFNNADDVLDLIVTKQTLDEVKKSSAIEILYPKPMDFYVGVRKSKIKNVNSILVSINNNTATIYYNIAGSYSSGPLVNRHGDIKNVRSLLQKLD